MPPKDNTPTETAKTKAGGYLELGTVGSFEKAWRFHSGSWYMYKQGNDKELISEYYSYLFLKAMDVRTAETAFTVPIPIRPVFRSTPDKLT